MKKAAMNRRKRLDAPSKQEVKERYESARRQNPGRNAKETSNTDVISSTETFKRPRDDSDKEDNTDLRDKIPKLSRTITGSQDTVNVGKPQDLSEPRSLVDPSYGDRAAVERFDYSHGKRDLAPGEGDDDDLRSLIDRQRKATHSEKLAALNPKNDDKHKKESSIFFDSKTGYGIKHLKDKKASSFKKSSKEKNDDYSSDKYKDTRHKDGSQTRKDLSGSASGFELGRGIFSGVSASPKSKTTSAEDMDINEAIKELSYLRSIQTGDNALPREEEEFFRELNDLSNAREKTIVEKFIEGRKNAQDAKSYSKNWKSLSANLGQSETKWEKMIDVMVGRDTSEMEAKTEILEGEKKPYGPPLPPKKPPSATMKKSSHSAERTNRERSSSRSRSVNEEHDSNQAIRGVHGSRGYRGGYRGRNFRAGYRGRGRGRGVFDPTRGRGRGERGSWGRGFRGRGIRGGRGFFPTRGRHIFPSRSGGRRSRSRSSSSSSSSSYSSRSRSRSHSRSRRRSRTKHTRHRSSSRSSYSSSSSRSRSKGRRKGQSKHRSRSYSSDSTSQSRSRSRSRTRNKRHSKERPRSRSKSSSRIRSKKRKGRSRSWSFDEDYTKKTQGKSKKDSSTSKFEKSGGKDRPKKGPEIKSQTRTKKDSEKEQVQSKKNPKEHSKKPLENNKGKTSAKERKTEQSPEISVKLSRHEPVVHDSSTVNSKDHKATASVPNVFLPRTVSRTVGKIDKGIQLPHGRALKPHPIFVATPEKEIAETKKPESSETEEKKKKKSHFHQEVDKVFNAKPWQQEKEEKKKGTWTCVWPETRPDNVTEPAEEKRGREEEEIRNDSSETNTVEKTVAEGKESVDKSEKEQKKEKREKRKKEKEEKNRRKKEKKEKKDKKKKDVDTPNKLDDEKDLDGTKDTAESQGSEPANPEPEFANYDNYSEPRQEYAGEQYKDYGQEQGWYDENGQSHANTEGDYIYYYNEEGNIVGYEGPEGYVEGNPFQAEAAPAEGQAWHGDSQHYGYEGVNLGQQPDFHTERAPLAEYTGAESQYEYAAAGAEAYMNVYPEGAEVAGGEYCADDAGQWEGYAGAGGVEQQWHGGEGNYPGEVTEYQHTGSEERYEYPVETAYAEPSQIYASSSYPQESTKSNVGAEPLAQITANSNVGDLVAAIAASGNSNLIEALAAAALDKNVFVTLLGKQLSKAQKMQTTSQPVDTNPTVPSQVPQKPPSYSSGGIMPRERQEIKKEHHLAPHGRKSSYYEAKAPQTKPLKSILKKGNSVPLKPPSKSEVSSDPDSSVLAKSNPVGTAGMEHVGPEYIVRVSKNGPACFFCKLCECHIESPTARELHVNSMKHIELFVREKSTLLNSVIGGKSPDGMTEFEEEATKQHQSTGTLGLSPELERAPVKRQEDDYVYPQWYHYQHQGRSRKDSESSHESRDKPAEISEDIDERNRLMDYDRLRLREWQLRELSDPSLDEEKDKPATTERGERRFKPETKRDIDEETFEQFQHKERLPPNVNERPRKDQLGYDRSRQPYSQEDEQRHYDRSDYKRPTRVMTDDVGKRRTKESIKQSSNQVRLYAEARHIPKHTEQGEQRENSHKQSHKQDDPKKRTAENRTDSPTNESKRPRNDRPSSSDRQSSVTSRKERRLSQDTPAQEESRHLLDSAPKEGDSQRDTNQGNTEKNPEEKQVENLDRKSSQGRPILEREERLRSQPSHGIPVAQRTRYDSSDTKKTDSRVHVAPGHHTSTSQHQEMSSTISTVIQGQSSARGRHVPPPPPPYSKGTGPQSFRGRGPIQTHIPPNHPGMVMAPHINQRPPAVGLPYPDAASRGLSRGHYPSRGVLRGIPGAPSHLSIGRANQPTFYGRGSSSHVPQGRGIGTAPFRGRGNRGIRGFRGQRW